MKNTKNMAGICLIVSLAVYVVASIFERRYPGLGYVIAFAEAAMVGGVADWFAVTALFRRPLNLPIPHTALISRNKDKIGKNLSVFVRENFLSESYVKETIKKIPLSEKIGELLGMNKRYLTNVAVRVLLSAVSKLEGEDLQRYLKGIAVKKFQEFNVQEITVKTLIDAFKKGTHHKVINFILNHVSDWLADPENKEMVIEYIKDIVKEDGGMFGSIKSYFVGDPDLKGSLDEFIFKYNHKHGERLRSKVDEYVLEFITYVHENPDCKKNIEEIKQNMINKIDLDTLLKNLVSEGQSMLKKDVTSSDSKVRKQIDEMIEGFINSLKTNEKVKGFVQDKALTYLPEFIVKNGQKIDEYFVNYLTKLDDKQISSLIEEKVGDDLQFIRINGTIVGGAIGLGIYSLTHLINYLLPLVG